MGRKIGCRTTVMLEQDEKKGPRKQMVPLCRRRNLEKVASPDLNVVSRSIAHEVLNRLLLNRGSGHSTFNGWSVRTMSMLLSRSTSTRATGSISITTGLLGFSNGSLTKSCMVNQCQISPDTVRALAFVAARLSRQASAAELGKWGVWHGRSSDHVRPDAEQSEPLNGDRRHGSGPKAQWARWVSTAADFIVPG